MTELGTRETDLTRPDNVIQARFELDRAMASSGYAALSSWAVRWGRMALSAIENPVREFDEEDFSEVEADAAKAEETVAKLSTAIETAIIKIDTAMEDHHPSSEFEGKLNTAVAILENAL
jgi:hypothetical protein